MFIDGIGISSYRSFGKQLQKIGPFGKINLFIGQNNSGKSNILLLLYKHYGSLMQSARKGGAVNFESLDHHIGEDSGEISIAFGVNLTGKKYDKVISQTGANNYPRLIEPLKKILLSKVISQDTDTAWFIYENVGGVLSLSKKFIEQVEEEHILRDDLWYEVWSTLTSQQGGEKLRHWIPEMLQKISPVNIEVPKVTLIPGIRKIGETGSPANDDYSGNGIIDRLAQLQNPSHDRQEQKEWFENINIFLRTVTGNQTATIEIPYKRDMILVHLDGKTLPLSSLGTGIHEVLILASAATILHNQVICIEEIELHQHPILQKKLIRYLNDMTDNQYFITTHSAHLLDTPGSAVFHVIYSQGHTIVEPVYTLVSGK